MKRLLLTLLSLPLITGFTRAQDKITLTSHIQKVTVFIEGAQVDRKVPVYLTPGMHEVTIPDLTPLLSAGTLQTKGTDNIDIVSVKTGKSYEEKKEHSHKEDSINAKINEGKNRLALLESTLQILEEEKAMLLENKELPSEGSDSWAENLEKAANFYRQRLKDISSESLDVRLEIDSIGRVIALSKKRLVTLPTEKPVEKTEVYLEIRVNRMIRDTLQLSYQVAQARWFPEYDFRVNDLRSPLKIEYKASISQQTGEDWKNVKMVVNTGSPNQASQAPHASTWWIRPYSPTYRQKQVSIGSTDYYDGSVSGIVVDSNGEPLPGVTVMVPSTSIGTVTDVEGRYSLQVPQGSNNLAYSFVGMQSVTHPIDGNLINVKMEEDVTQLSEVVVTGMAGSASGINTRALNRGPIRIRGNATLAAGSSHHTSIRGSYGMEDNIQDLDGTTESLSFSPSPKEFEIQQTFSLKSHPEPKKIRLESYQVDAEYSYFALPRKDKRAYLQANITDWQRLNMLDGTANLFLENTFLGRIPFMKDQLDDTLQIDLGPDPKVQVGYETVKDLSGTQFFGNKKKENRVYEIKVKNNRLFPVSVKVVDLIPKPMMESIKVERIGESGDYDEEEGTVTWSLNLKPSEVETLRTGFELKHPSGIALHLE
ncbi:mucoidy inhibitor MuiA family protein [Roseivirga sp. BDSF3-8]|uniref:mucoidy inhibitor MuiA family protein n=1 Tax=Roseivirga sp. BDSF3-8 TaxID=3241598 RepID=UPI003531FC8B